MEQYKKRTRNQGNEQNQDRRQNQTHNNGKNDHDKVFNCNKCGKQHKFRECPAYRKECRIYKKLNHFAYKCKNNRQVDMVECESDNMSIEYLILDEIDNKDNNNIWLEKVKINDINTEVKIDTGAQLNVMPNKFYKKLKTEIKNSKVVIKVFDGTIIKSLGKVQVAVVGQSARIITIFEVVEYDGNPILGYKDCKRLNYISELNKIKEVGTENRNFKQKIEKTDNTLKDIVHTMEVVNLKFKNNKEGEFKKAILEDNTLKLVEQYLREEWPKNMNSLGDIRHYHKIRNELMLEKGLIYYGCRLVVPRVMCKYIIKELHETHLDITNAIIICETCIKFSIKKIKELLKQHERPSVPFQKVGLDIVEISAHYAKSNGLAEKAIGIAKGMITKARYEKKDLNLVLLNYRNSPVAGLEYSPAQLLMARELRTYTNFLNPNIFKPKLVNCAGEMQKQENYQKHWYDKTAGPEEKQFTEGEKVYTYDNLKKEWDEGEIVKKTKWPRSYYVKNAKGKVLRRNNCYIKKKFKIKDKLINDDVMNIDKKRMMIVRKITIKMTLMKIKVLGVRH
ncbi:Aspartic peptidase domain,Zinc finger, CCHC-type [Cinara cedri]|uniref:Aspartic peptidase domain,Zinc finger, CCHC-type n=1 Tax=Cinara cedri TaxID=506608 RepID=A0A5E4M229_9HEMI|nr:Aspartic peptidase domain,Zinc finger, CCHC-type [Cinara cedri]